MRPGELPPEKEASIILPGSLFLHVDDRSDIGSFYGLFDSTNLFPIRGGNTDNQANATRVTKLGSSILSATVGDESVSFENLHEAVSVTLRLNFNDSVSPPKFNHWI